MWGKTRYLFAVGTVALAPLALGATQPMGIDLGGASFIPTLTVTQSHDSNIFDQPVNEKATMITRAAPQLQLFTEDGANQFAATYIGNYGWYADSTADDYYDHTFRADATVSPTDRNNFNFSLGYAKQHDDRGTGGSQGAGAFSRTNPDTYHRHWINGTWDYGVEGTPVSFELSGGRLGIVYVNNRSLTQFRDHAVDNVAGRIYGNFTGKTRYFVEYGENNYAYDYPFLVSLDSKERAAFVGVQWEITGKTSGSAKIGSTKKDFDAASRTDTTFTSWQAQVVWQPRTYSTFTLTSERGPQETNGTGAFIESANHRLVWDHQWQQDVHSQVSYVHGHDQYPGSTRDDARNDFSAGIDMDVKRWVNVGVSYEHSNLDSNINTFDYHRNIFSVTLNVSM